MKKSIHYTILLSVLLLLYSIAGYGQNAFYDRASKSLQFYYFDKEGKRVYTCLSTDIINHEFGHAVLDGIRPHYHESSLIETGAFHEFVGDLTAILLILAFQHGSVASRGITEEALECSDDENAFLTSSVKCTCTRSACK